MFHCVIKIVRQVLERLSVGCRIKDEAQIIFSLDACPPEADR